MPRGPLSMSGGLGPPWRSCQPPAQFVTSAWALWRMPMVPGSQNWTSSCQGPGNQGAQQQNNSITGCQKGSSRLTAHVFICSRVYVGKFTASTCCGKRFLVQKMVWWVVSCSSGNMSPRFFRFPCGMSLNGRMASGRIVSLSWVI